MQNIFPPIIALATPLPRAIADSTSLRYQTVRPKSTPADHWPCRVVFVAPLAHKFRRWTSPSVHNGRWKVPAVDQSQVRQQGSGCMSTYLFCSFFDFTVNVKVPFSPISTPRILRNETAYTGKMKTLQHSWSVWGFCFAWRLDDLLTDDVSVKRLGVWKAEPKRVC